MRALLACLMLIVPIVAAPTVTITAPVNGATVHVGDVLQITATSNVAQSHWLVTVGGLEVAYPYRVRFAAGEMDWTVAVTVKDSAGATAVAKAVIHVVK